MLPEIIEYADHNAGVMAVSPGRLNPYKIGVELYRYIEDRWNKGRFGKEYDECDDLRARREDIPLLIQAFVEEFDAKYERKVRGVDEAALRLLVAHDWPGNVRQLRNTVERAVISCAGELITAADLPSEPGPSGPEEPRAGAPVPMGVKLKDVERDVILKTLASVGNNKTRAAEVLGISLKTLHNKLNRYGV